LLADAFGHLDERSERALYVVVSKDYHQTENADPTVRPVVGDGVDIGLDGRQHRRVTRPFCDVDGRAETAVLLWRTVGGSNPSSTAVNPTTVSVFSSRATNASTVRSWSNAVARRSTSARAAAAASSAGDTSATASLATSSVTRRSKRVSVRRL
jgi:hypothetical protein